MKEKLLEWDKNLFLSLNADCGALLDSIMWYFSWIGSFVILAFFFYFLMYKNRGYSIKQILILLLVMGFIVLLADQTSNFFKENMSKFRPTHNPELKGMIHTVNGYIGGLYGTVSGHAANAFGLASFMVLVYNRRWFSWFALSYAAIIAYSRIYLGVHYPLDLIFGTFFGLLYGYLVYRLYMRYIVKIKI